MKVWGFSKGRLSGEVPWPNRIPKTFAAVRLRRAMKVNGPTVVAQRFRIGRSSVYLWLKQRREEGRDRPKKMGGGPRPVIRDAVRAAIRRLVESDNHLTLAQYQDQLADETGIRVHPWTVGRALRRLRLTRKQRRRCAPPSKTRPRSSRRGRSGAPS